MREQICAHYRKFVQDIKDSAKEYLCREMPVLRMDDFLIYEKTGNRLIYEEKYFERRKYLVVYALVLLFEEKREYAQKLEAVLNEICKERTWALPAHVNRDISNWENTIDLFAAETAQALAWIYDNFRDKISGNIRKRLRENVIKRVLLPYRSSPYQSQRFENMCNNWTSVCLGCIGSAALHIYGVEEHVGVRSSPLKTDEYSYEGRSMDKAVCPEKESKTTDEKQLRVILDRVLYFLPNYLKGISDDGVCPEGLSYFTYGMVYYIGFAEQIYRYSNEKINLFSDSKLERLAKFQQNCYLPGNATISFSDGERRDRFRLGLGVFLSETFEGIYLPDIDSAMNLFSDHCFRFMANVQDVLWTERFLEKAGQKKKLSDRPDHEEFIFYGDAEWAIWKQKHMGVAIKGGHNAEEHNHNDVGSFLMTAEGEIYLSDLGCGEYTRDYFGERRYQRLCTRSLGHNVPLVNKREQKCGREYAAGSFISPDRGGVKISFANAYEEMPRFTLTRELKAVKTDLFELIDAFTAKDGGEFTENFITQIEPKIVETDIRENDVTKRVQEIHLAGSKGRMVIGGIFDPVEIHREIFRNHQGMEEDCWLIRFSLKTAKEANSEATCRLLFRYEKHECIF